MHSARMGAVNFMLAENCYKHSDVLGVSGKRFAYEVTKLDRHLELDDREGFLGADSRLYKMCSDVMFPIFHKCILVPRV